MLLFKILDDLFLGQINLCLAEVHEDYILASSVLGTGQTCIGTEDLQFI